MSSTDIAIYTKCMCIQDYDRKFQEYDIVFKKGSVYTIQDKSAKCYYIPCEDKYEIAFTIEAADYDGRDLLSGMFDDYFMTIEQYRQYQIENILCG